jgi:hypothetical protein
MVAEPRSRHSARRRARRPTIADLRAAGAASLRVVADELNARGIRTVRCSDDGDKGDRHVRAQGCRRDDRVPFTWSSSHHPWMQGRLRDERQRQNSHTTIDGSQ